MITSIVLNVLVLMAHGEGSSQQKSNRSTGNSAEDGQPTEIDPKPFAFKELESKCFDEKTAPNHVFEVDLNLNPEKGRLFSTRMPHNNENVKKAKGCAVSVEGMKELYKKKLKSITDVYVLAFKYEDVDFGPHGGLKEFYRELGIEMHRFPFPNMAAPSVGYLHILVSEIKRKLIHERKDILVHCQGGTGRTGLVLASVLYEITNSETPIKDLRKSRNGKEHWVEDLEQVNLLRVLMKKEFVSGAGCESKPETQDWCGSLSNEHNPLSAKVVKYSENMEEDADKDSKVLKTRKNWIHDYEDVKSIVKRYKTTHAGCNRMFIDWILYSEQEKARGEFAAMEEYHQQQKKKKQPRLW